MVLGMLSKNIELLLLLPWWQIIVASAVAYCIGWVWYGRVFKKQYKQLIENRGKTNRTALIVQLVAVVLTAYLIGILSLFPDMFLLGVDAVIGVVLFILLAGILFQQGATRNAMGFWLVAAGYEAIAILSIAVIILQFS